MSSQSTVFDATVVRALVQVVTGPRQRVDVPLDRRHVDPVLRRTEERHPSVIILNPWVVLVEVVIEDLTRFLLEVDLPFTSVAIPETGPYLGAVANVEVAFVAVIVSDAQSMHSTRANPCVPDQIEHRVATGRVVELLAALQDDLHFMRRQLVGSHVLHVTDDLGA